MCSMAAPASRQARAVAASASAVIGKAAWSRGCLWAPFGATVTISGLPLHAEVLAGGGVGEDRGVAAPCRSAGGRGCRLALAGERGLALVPCGIGPGRRHPGAALC